MQWTAGGGFSEADVEPWLPMGKADVCNVADQREDPTSVLHLCRDLIAIRRGRADLHSGSYEALDAVDGIWAWRRGEATTVILNHGEARAVVPTRPATVLIATDRERDGERVDGTVRLDPWEALVLGDRG